MDSNNMYQNQQPGGEQNPNNQNNNQNGYYQNTYTGGDNNQNAYTNANYQPNPYNNGGYQQAPMYQQMDTDLEEPVTMGEWAVSILLMMVPCVNIVMMFVWAFGSGTKKSKSNFFKVQLIVSAIMIVLSFIFSASIIGALGSMYY